MNATAITKCANASQSVPYARKGYFALVSINPSRTRTIHAANPEVPASASAWIKFENHRNSVSNGNAVIPLSTNPTIKIHSQNLTLVRVDISAEDKVSRNRREKREPKF